MDWEILTKRNVMRLAYWTSAWTVTMAMATFGPQNLWPADSALTILGIIINAAIGIGMIIVNKRYLRGLDEMQQEIQLEAMALALGVGIVSGLSYSLLDITNVISTDAEISHLVVLMGLVYLVGIIIGRIRYR